MLYEASYDDLIDDDFISQIAAIKMLGHQLLPILNDSMPLKAAFITILNKLQQGFSANEINQIYTYDPGDQQITR